MISLGELITAYVASFVVTLLICVTYYIAYVRRPIKMLLVALHASKDKQELPGQLNVIQGPLSSLTREINAFTKWAGEMNAVEKQKRILREITADISHDFRSPLTSIQGYAERLLQKGYSIPKEEAADYLQIILSNTKKLNEYVNDLLDLAKFDSSSISPKFERFSISTLASSIENKFGLSARNKEISFSIQTGPKLPLAYGDPLMIERALSNIVENAICYTPKGGIVVVDFRKTFHAIQVSVKDTGEGIPPEDLPFVFDRFYRVNKDRSLKSGGTGLGLSIAKAIIDAHGGSIKLGSDLGKGTVVSFQIPA
ncbi:MAG: hypothetical protein GYA55_06745 [SAR324 cluster bacterium]|uniref:histidine kinase n=1 Tax=SAR324 cluster bacterium TaxID=2024889 RepID=A0A7X9FR91_9DELT|nr:hypothetical protein [SAR324 cluster bacterium]